MSQFLQQIDRKWEGNERERDRQTVEEPVAYTDLRDIQTNGTVGSYLGPSWFKQTVTEQKQKMKKNVQHL